MAAGTEGHIAQTDAEATDLRGAFFWIGSHLLYVAPTLCRPALRFMRNPPRPAYGTPPHHEWFVGYSETGDISGLVPK